MAGRGVSGWRGACAVNGGEVQEAPRRGILGVNELVSRMIVHLYVPLNTVWGSLNMNKVDLIQTLLQTEPGWCQNRMDSRISLSLQLKVVMLIKDARFEKHLKLFAALTRCRKPQTLLEEGERILFVMK